MLGLLAWGVFGVMGLVDAVKRELEDARCRELSRGDGDPTYISPKGYCLFRDTGECAFGCCAYRRARPGEFDRFADERLLLPDYRRYNGWVKRMAYRNVSGTRLVVLNDNERERENLCIGLLEDPTYSLYAQTCHKIIINGEEWYWSYRALNS